MQQKSENLGTESFLNHLFSFIGFIHVQGEEKRPTRFFL